MSLSPQTLKSVGEALGTDILYITKICHISQMSINYYICIGTRQFYFFDENFQFVKGQVKYIHLLRILVSKKNDQLLQLHFSEQKDKNMPLKMNIYTEDRKAIIDYLKYSWKTDFMFHQYEVKELPIYKYDIILDQESQQIKKKKNFNFIQNGFYQFKKVIFIQFLIFIQYIFKKYQDCQIFVQITDMLPLEIIKSMGIRKDLEQYALYYAQYIVQEHNYDTFYILSSNQYNKRHNYTEDLSQWKGWELQIKVRVSNKAVKTIGIIILRRMYLPPLLDNFNDIALVIFGNKQSIQGNNNKIQIKIGNQKECEIIQIIRQVADSFYYKNINQNVYKTLIKAKCDSLSIDYEQYAYLLTLNGILIYIYIDIIYIQIRQNISEIYNLWT
ncbi:nd9 protein, putative [Ichthyophthirius multifiliis]|uniref:Nd9 protein, putative n=1 Tax=Ichthyophthirius multifiliis TaxID=5932 RepID=G0QP79_ICHMU|nr:nd9 protein, putative [Ichthyophthirius multifiliis]EGR32977.1 nd9 protein, putative [Ichthyophthirius multifiliis]|eukprot:XP_004036963.1 nd9 protein, putative [Ichthyophthirius multifiliis]